MLVGGDKLVRTFHYVWVSIILPVGPPEHLLGIEGYEHWVSVVWMEEWKNGVLMEKILYM